jgi:hypothetical protein
MKRYLEEIPELEYVLLAIDHTPWTRPDAKTLCIVHSTNFTEVFFSIIS